MSLKKLSNVADCFLMVPVRDALNAVITIIGCQVSVIFRVLLPVS